MALFLARVVANIAGLVVIDWLFASIVFTSAGSFVLAAILLGLVNAFIRPILQVLALPLTIVTFGLFALVINAACLGLVAWMMDGFDVGPFVPTFFAAIVLSLVSAFASRLLAAQVED
ncbi:phage holin family protein [bacterium]|nr:phage holin family protein [bacterium]